MATQTWFDRLRSAFVAMMRRRGIGARPDDRVIAAHAEVDPVQAVLCERRLQLTGMIRGAFAERAPAKLELEWLDTYIDTNAGFEAVGEMLSLLGMRGLEFDPEKIIAWYTMGIPSATLYGIFELTHPGSLDELNQLYDVLLTSAQRPRVESLSLVSTAYQRLNRPLAIGNFVLALETVGSGSEYANTFCLCVEGYQRLGLVDARLDKLLLERLRDEEALAAAAAFVDVISHHLAEGTNFNDIEALLSALRDRVGVRRLSRVLSLFEEFGVNVGSLDTFHLTFATSQPDLEWLERALNGMKDLGRNVERITLIQLREWAPDFGALGRYITAARSFQGLGLSDDEVDRLVLQRVETEEKSQVLGILGEVWGRLKLGDLNYERAEHLANTLSDRVRVKRFEVAVNSLKDLKLPVSDVEVLAEQFIGETEELNWLETVLASSGEFGDRLGRLQILHLRERCPEPPHLYRYFRLKRAFEWFNGDVSALDAWLVDIAPYAEPTSVLLALAEVFATHPERPSLPEIKRLNAEFNTPELIEAFAVCVRTFNGNWQKFEVLLGKLNTSADMEGDLAIVSQSISMGRLSGNAFERAIETLVTHHRRKTASS